MNLVKLVEQFGSDQRCRDYLQELRWPGGLECPRCKSKSISRIVERRQFDCNDCRYQFSVTSGTIFHDSHLPPWKWFLAIYLVIESKNGISANQVKRTLDISYKTAWYLCHRIRAAMSDGKPELLKGTVAVDETLVGGKKRGMDRSFHKVSLKHLAAYLDELKFRFNNRHNDWLFRDTLIRLITSDSLKFSELTGK